MQRAMDDKAPSGATETFLVDTECLTDKLGLLGNIDNSRRRQTVFHIHLLVYE